MPPDPLVLGFDTSAAHCAAALLSGDRVLSARCETMGKGQAERLIGMLEEVLAEARAGWSDLSALGVGIGPGNFTGIRISVSAARGLSMGLRVPAVGVSTLDAVLEGQSGPAWACIDARRETVYLQGTPGLAMQGAVHVALDALPPLSNAVCVGSAAKAVAERAGLVAVAPVYPVAEAIARIALRRAETTTDAPKPLYIRAPDAAPSREPGPKVLS